MSVSTDIIRTIAIAGHGQTGKTTFVENLLVAGKVIPHAESVASGKTVSDYTPEEIERKISIYASLLHMEYKNLLLNFWDTPGSSDFIGEVITAFRCSEQALMLLDACNGVQIETIKYWRQLDERGKPRMVFVNKMDAERADFGGSVKNLKTQFKADAFLVSFPMGEGEQYRGVVDVLHGVAYEFDNAGREKQIPIPAEYIEEFKNQREVLSGAAAEGEEELLVKFIDEGELTDEEITRGLKAAFAANHIVPVFAGAAEKGSGLKVLLDFIAEISCSPKMAKERVVFNDTVEIVPIEPEAPFSALVVKTANDRFSGRMSYIKVIGGALQADSEVYNLIAEKKERVGKLYRPIGKKLIEVHEIVAGDIGVAVKLQETNTNDTLAAEASAKPFVALRTPDPIYSLAVSATEEKNNDKLSEQLCKACEEDMTLLYEYNSETKQSVLSGMGDLHIMIVLERIQKQFKIEFVTSVPRIAFRETIQRSAQAEYTHKKQSGGHGQFARVLLSIEPLPRGERYKFSNAVFGGAISKGYIPGVEKGVIEAMQQGVLAAYPVVDVATTVLDGKEHPVDSSELAFKIAARYAFKDAMRNAGAVLLEPIMNLLVFVDMSYLGDVMSDLSARRGRILGQSSLASGIEEIRAQVPHKELLRYAIDLRAMTSGTGSFEMSFAHYSPITGKIADEIIAEA